jgi:phage shock protein PspC (stress-responsive transcriptional regulator)
MAPPPRFGGAQFSELRRSATDRKIAGVCGGLGRWLNVDPLVFRVVFAVLALFGGAGLLAYGLAWLLVPDEGAAMSEAEALLRHGRHSGGQFVAALLVLVGVTAFGGVLFGGPGPLGLVALAAIAVLVVASARRPAQAGAPAAFAPPASGPTTAAPPYNPAHAPYDPARVPYDPARVPYDPARVPYAPVAAPAPPPGWPVGPPLPPPPPPAPRPPKQRSYLAAIVLSGALVVAGSILAWADVTDNDTDAAVVIAAVLAVLGIGLVVAAWWGRARSLIGWAVVAALALGAATAVDVDVRGGTGERSWEPRSVSELQSPYRLGAGEADLDLTELDASGTVEVRASLGMGDLRVHVPTDVDVVVDAHAGFGVVDLPGFEDGGTSVDVERTDPAPSGPARATLRLVLDVDMGRVAVLQGAPLDDPYTPGPATPTPATPTPSTPTTSTPTAEETP